MKFAEEGQYGDIKCEKCSTDKPYDDIYGGGVSKQQLLTHFSEEDLMDIIGIEKMTVYIRKKKLNKIRYAIYATSTTT